MTIDELSARLERVEGQNQRLRAGGVALAVLLAAGVAMGQAAPAQKVVRAERWEVVDGEGTVRAKCYVTSEGALSLELSDKSGKRRGMFGVNNDGFPFMVFQDPEGQPVAALHTGAGGLTAFGLTADGGKGGVLLGNSSDGSREMVFMGSGGKPQIKFTVGADGNPEIGMWDKDGAALLRVPPK